MKFTELFLKAKHWQLFSLLFGIPMIFQIVMMGSLFVNLASGNAQNPLFMLGYLKFFPIMMIIFMGVFFGWFWSIAIGLQKNIPEGIKMKTTKFKVFFFIPMIYIFLISLGIGAAMSGLTSGGNKLDPSLLIGVMGIVFPLHLFSMFCIFYSLYFVAKTIKTVELQRETKFDDFVGEFFLMWFYPIGVWIIQPKINKMVEEDTTVSK